MWPGTDIPALRGGVVWAGLRTLKWRARDAGVWGQKKVVTWPEYLGPCLGQCDWKDTPASLKPAEGHRQPLWPCQCLQHPQQAQEGKTQPQILQRGWVSGPGTQW